MKHVSLVSTDTERTSTLILEEKEQKITVLGGLPHNYSFIPKTQKDRDALVSYLKSIEY